MKSPQLRVLSLGGGVQTTALALMAAAGEIEAPDCGIFADTGWEPPAVYEHLEWLASALPFPVHRVSAGNLREDIARGMSDRAGRFAAVPWHVRNADGSAGLGRRQCTAHYKLEPIQREIRRRLSGNEPKRRLPRGAAEVWVGITTDEIWRMKPARVGYIANRWPLIERRLSRWDCLRWLEKRGYSAPKSACIGCPYQSNARWRETRETDPASWAEACRLDALVRNGGSARGIRGQQFMHRSLVPLAEADLSTVEDRGQGNLFNEECEGMCGV